MFGQVTRSIDENGKEHTNVRILDFKLLKAKDRGKVREEKKESILEAIKKHKAENKDKNSVKVEHKHDKER